MANSYGVFRSNRFPVRDRDRFHAWAKTIPDLDVQEHDGRVLLVPSEWSGGHGLPGLRETGEGEHEAIEFVDELAPHVAPGSVAVLVEAGSEKLRYLTGIALAIRGADDPAGWAIERVHLDDVYEKAATAWGIDPGTIDHATY